MSMKYTDITTYKSIYRVHMMPVKFPMTAGHDGAHL